MKRLALLILLVTCALLPILAQTFGSTNANRIRGRNVDPTAPTVNQTLLWKCAVPSVIFTGAGLNDATSGGTCTAATASLYEIAIDSATASPDTFKWRKDGGSYTTGVAMTGAAQTLADGVTITFKATDGHTLADAWAIQTTVSWTPSTATAGGGAPADTVTGASTLTTPGALTKVGATAGTVAESGVYDDGAGLVKIGTATKPAGLTAANLTATALTTPTITSVTPSANDGVTCTYTLTAYAGDGTSTAASATSSTAVGPTNCNSNTIVWTAATNVTRYQLDRTVGGTTQGLITAMEAWLNNTTNCPAGTCTYIDTGSAASGSAPSVNTTGRLLMGNKITCATDGGCDIGATPSNRFGNIYATGGGYFLGDVRIDNVARFYWNGRLLLYSPAAGMLGFDGITSSYPALKRSGAKIEIRLADDSGSAALDAAPGGTVPACKTVTVLSTNAAFQAASTTATVALEILPAKAIITGMDIKHSVQFSDGGGAMTEVGVTVGSPAGGATFFSANQNIGEATAVADTTLLSTSLFKRATAASEALNAYFTATDRDFGDGAGATYLTGGSVDIGYCYFVKP